MRFCTKCGEKKDSLHKIQVRCSSTSYTRYFCDTCYKDFTNFIKVYNASVTVQEKTAIEPGLKLKNKMGSTLDIVVKNGKQRIEG